MGLYKAANDTKVRAGAPAGMAGLQTDGDAGTGSQR